jgi:Phage portal protein, SPP1 Gp6-like
MTDLLLSANGSEDDRLEAGKPTWWLHRLCGKLALDQPRMALMDRYYRGDHPLPYVPRELKQEFQRMLARSRSNFMRLVVQAPAERLRVQGFRQAGAEDADDDVWEWWTDTCEMDIDSNLAISDSMAMGRSYLSVWKYQGEDEPRVQVEDPRTTITERDVQNRRKRAAGLRLWLDEWTNKVRADVYLPDAVYQFETVKSSSTILTSKLWPQFWEPAYPIDDTLVRYTDLVLREDSAASLLQWSYQWKELEALPNPSGEIPLVPLVNYPSVLKQPDGESELDDVYLTQDRINEMLFNRALAAWTTAYRQKWATGLEIPVDDDGNEVQPFRAAVDRLWISEDPDTKFGEFGETDLKNYIQSVEEDVQHIAVQTRTPRHYFLQQGQSPSGDAIKSAEAGLVAKVYEKQLYLGRAFSEVIRLRDTMLGESTPRRMETIWQDPEFRTMAELTDAIIKQHGAGLIPTRVAREKLGNSPSEITRMERLEAQDDLMREAAGLVEEQEQLEVDTGGEPIATEEAPANPEPALTGNA